MRVVVLQFLSLDGVTQGPGAPDEDRSDGFDRGGWLVPFIDDAFLARVSEWTLPAEAFLFGRRTYEAFARDWPQMDDPADAVATKLNRGRKYAASRTPIEASWENSTVVSDAAATVSALKADGGGELQIHGSTTLARALMSAGLVDELRLATAPVVLGKGRRLFSGELPAIGLTRLSSQVTPAGLLLERFEVAGPVAYGSYGPEIVG